MIWRGRLVRREWYRLVPTTARAGSRLSGSESTRESYSQVPPRLCRFSRTTTRWPSRWSSRAAARPATPAPITATLANRAIRNETAPSGECDRLSFQKTLRMVQEMNVMAWPRWKTMTMRTRRRFFKFIMPKW